MTKMSPSGRLERGPEQQGGGRKPSRRLEQAATETGSHLVIIVNADRGLREALQRLLATSDLHTAVFGSAAEYLAFPKPAVPACLILDVDLPDTNGLDLQEQIGHDYHPPIIFVTGRGDIPSSVRAIRGGAVEFLTKPYCEQHLLQLVHGALAQDQELRIEQAETHELKRLYESLTSREREVLPLVVSGLLNKQAASYLGISDVTLQIHRTNIMRKMAADSFADLVRMAIALKIPVMFSRRGPAP